MSDLALIWSNDIFGADLAMAGPDLAVDPTLKTAVIISLFTDARARDDDELPQPGADRRGWWGDVGAEVEGDRYGSRLWLLAREKQLPRVLALAEEYAAEALAWLVQDGVASAVTVTASNPRYGWLELDVQITRPTGPARMKFDYAWRSL